MDERTKEYVESARNADKLEEQAIQIAQVIGLEEPGEFGAKYIEKAIISNEGVLDYQVYPSGGTADYAVVEEVTPNSAEGESASLGSGPLHRLRKNGFIVTDTAVYINSACYLLRKYSDQLPDKHFVTYIKYIGAEHPIIEYWDEE